MSGTAPPPPIQPNSPAVTLWGAPIVSVLAYATFLAAIVVAMLIKNDVLLVTLCGAAAANATTAVQWWLGSSKSAADAHATVERQGAQMAVMGPDPVAPVKPAAGATP